MVKFFKKKETDIKRYKELYKETLELVNDSFFEDDKNCILDFEKMTEIYMIIDENNSVKKHSSNELDTFDKETIIQFEDENLKDKILEHFGKEENENIKIGDVIHTFSLNLSQSNIKSIKGLEYFLNLETLYLYDNKIEDISSIAALKNLTNLHLFENNIENIEALQNLVNLESLSISNNKIKDISSLENLKNLKKLLLSNNEIESLKALRRLTQLKHLSLYCNKIINIDDLEYLNHLRYLSLSNNKIENISILCGLSKLEMLFLESNNIKNIDCLRHLKNLKELEIKKNKIEDFSSLDYFSYSVVSNY